MDFYMKSLEPIDEFVENAIFDAISRIIGNNQSNVSLLIKLISKQNIKIQIVRIDMIANIIEIFY